MSRAPVRPATWASIRPVLVGFALAADAIVVGALAIDRPEGWVPPRQPAEDPPGGFAGLEAWAIRHSQDDDRRN